MFHHIETAKQDRGTALATHALSGPEGLPNGTAKRSRRIKKAHPADDLSFMAKRKPRGTGIDYWVVEGTGSYGTDCEKGAELAKEYLSYVGKHPTYGNVSLLGCIVNGMIARSEVREKGRLTGIEIAFLSGINSYAVTCAVAVQAGALK